MRNTWTLRCFHQSVSQAGRAFWLVKLFATISVDDNHQQPILEVEKQIVHVSVNEVNETEDSILPMTKRAGIPVFNLYLASASQFPDLSKLSNIYIMRAAALKYLFSSSSSIL